MTKKIIVDGHFIKLMEEAKLDSRLMDWCELAETIIDIELMIEETQKQEHKEQYNEILKVYEEEKESRIPVTDWKARWENEADNAFFTQEDLSD